MSKLYLIENAHLDPVWLRRRQEVFSEVLATFRSASELNFPLPTVLGSFHKGSLPETNCCFECDSDSVITTAIKKAEASDAVILRAYEADGGSASANIKLFGKNISAEFSHNELITLSDGKRANILEEYL